MMPTDSRAFSEAAPGAPAGSLFVQPFPASRFVERGPGAERNNDITRDGKQFIGVVAAGQSATASGTAAAPQIQVVLNWFEELRQRVPTK